MPSLSCTQTNRSEELGTEIKLRDIKKLLKAPKCLDPESIYRNQIKVKIISDNYDNCYKNKSVEF